jgi:hypothetical protein
MAVLPSNLMEEIASDEVIDEAYRWLCHRRKSYSANDSDGAGPFNSHEA